MNPAPQPCKFRGKEGYLITYFSYQNYAQFITEKEISLKISSERDKLWIYTDPNKNIFNIKLSLPFVTQSVKDKTKAALVII